MLVPKSARHLCTDCIHCTLPQSLRVLIIRHEKCGCCFLFLTSPLKLPLESFRHSCFLLLQTSEGKLTLHQH